MATISLPALPRLFTSIQWKLTIPQQKNKSEFTGRTQLIGLPGFAYWTVRATVRPATTEAEVRAWRLFFAQLRGGENNFFMPATPTDQLTAAQVEPQVTGANMTDRRAIVLDSNAIVEPGMMAGIEQVDGHIRLVTITDKPNPTWIFFEPERLDDGATAVPLRLRTPGGLVRMTSGEHEWSDADGIAGFTIDAEEDL